MSAPTSNNKRHRVFVYGTLKKSEPNHRVLSESEGCYTFLGPAKTNEKFPLIISTRFNIPFVLYKPGEGHRIEGELYEVDDDKFKILDKLEEYPIIYQRSVIECTLEDGTQIKAYIYVLNSWRYDLITSSTGNLASYSSNGSHGRPYLDRYVRAQLMKEEESNIFVEILGYDPRKEERQNIEQKKDGEK